MATIYNKLTIAHDETTYNDQRDLYAETGMKDLAGRKLIDYAKKVASGSRPSNVRTQVNLAVATGTITLTSHVAADTVTINGTVFTCVASGATGNQYNVGAADTNTGDNLAAAINASATALVVNNVTAANAAGVVTITATAPGTLGNCITIAISAHGSVSGARLTGGTVGDQDVKHYYGSGQATTP